MHPLEGGDYQIVSGDRRFKDDDPATEVVAVDMNAIHLSMVRLVTASGQSLMANSAADLSDNWMQVVRAVRRLSRRMVIGDLTLNNATTTCVLDDDTFAFRLLEDTSRPGAVAVLDASNPNNDRRLIVLWNGTATYKYVANQTPAGVGLVTLLPGESAVFFGVPGGSGTEWQALGAPKEGVLDVELNDGSSQIATGSLYWSIVGGKVHVVVPALQSIIYGGTPTGFYITGLGNAALPSFLDMPTYGGSTMESPVLLIDNGTRSVGYARQTGSAGSRRFLIAKMSGGAFTAPSGGNATGLQSLQCQYPLRVIAG